MIGVGNTTASGRAYMIGAPWSKDSHDALMEEGHYEMEASDGSSNPWHHGCIVREAISL